MPAVRVGDVFVLRRAERVIEAPLDFSQPVGSVVSPVGDAANEIRDFTHLAEMVGLDPGGAVHHPLQARLTEALQRVNVSAVHHLDGRRELVAERDGLQERSRPTSIARDAVVLPRFEAVDHFLYCGVRECRPGKDRVDEAPFELVAVPLESLDEVGHALLADTQRKLGGDTEPPRLLVVELCRHPATALDHATDPLLDVAATVRDGLEHIVLVRGERFRAALNGTNDEHVAVHIPAVDGIEGILHAREECADLLSKLRVGMHEILEEADVLAVRLCIDPTLEAGLQCEPKLFVAHHDERAEKDDFVLHSACRTTHGAVHAEHPCFEAGDDRKALQLGGIVGSVDFAARGEDHFAIHLREPLEHLEALGAARHAPHRSFGETRGFAFNDASDVAGTVRSDDALVIDEEHQCEHVDEGEGRDGLVAKGADHDIFRSECDTGTGVPAQENSQVCGLTSKGYFAILCAFFNSPYAIAVIPKLTFKGSPTPFPPRVEGPAGRGLRKV